VSLKKELDGDEVDSIVPILVHNKRITAQEAVDETVVMLKRGFQQFQKAADRLKNECHAENADTKRDVGIWVNSCVDLILGNISWSLRTDRYMLKAELNKDRTGFEQVL
jgi:hypothetical protein